MDALYCSLPYRAAEDMATIYLGYSSTNAYHAFVMASNASNATTKGWAVMDGSNTATTTGSYLCGSTLVPTTQVTINNASTTVEAGFTLILTATVQPANATYKAVTWSSSNTAVATVNSSGVVTGVSAGTATITAKAVDGSTEAKCSVTVVTPQTTPPDGTPVITLTVTNNATIIFSMSAAAEYTHAWVEAVPGTYTPTTIGTEPTEKSIRVTGTTLKIYGPITGLDCGGKQRNADRDRRITEHCADRPRLLHKPAYSTETFPKTPR